MTAAPQARSRPAPVDPRQSADGSAGLSPTDLAERLPGLTLADEHRLRARLKRGRRGKRPGGGQDDILDELREAESRVQLRRAAVPTVSYPAQLPVSARRDELLEVIRDNQVVIVAGETGSGKTTQLPKICLELGRGVRGMIGHTQPRRIAARTVAERIADELDVAVGASVGYAVRFSDRSGDETLVRLMTDGLLLAEIQHDRLLRRYDTIIVDEAHERTLNIDFLLGYLKQILPRRPDLKLIITSATIDPERFSRHFGGAPVVEVSGRTYPVEERYRPLADPDDPTGERDEIDAIGDAVEELLAEEPGDVLVFLSGEREIRDTADALGGRLPAGVEILPLYARLSHAEQHRVFRPHSAPRVVLATNVAETSLTVPGIRYVVDPGNARISRYSARLKVQRLPIEPVSQASANQRKGRCGRTSEGICVRLYSEQEFLERPAFTDPEIVRTNLASVILQMAANGLGDVEDFPFLDPPDARQIRDGLNLLRELGAFQPSARDSGRRLTALGRRLAQLPVDPRLGRMVLEADRLGCADEVMIIVAALSIQDPRERPVDARQAADELHARFADDTSDFLTYLNLWRHLRAQQESLSSSQFRKRCRSEFLNHLRVREWQDLVAQLRKAARAVGVTANREPAEPRHIHVALLSGLLSHVGMRDPQRRDYIGARNARFSVFPGSALSKRQPAWLMVAELVETSRLWGRTAARIDPQWIEPLAEHLVKRSYADPHWERRRAAAVATERVTLYGLPIVSGRKVPYGRIDPAVSRDLFIRRALVDGDWNTKHDFFHANRRLIAELADLEHRARRRDIILDEHALHAFYDARIPGEVVSGAHFDSWWRKERNHRPDLLTLTPDVLLHEDRASEVLDPSAWPETWRQDDVELRLSYRFEPGSENDGVTVHVPLGVLGRLRPDGFEWLVPGLRMELLTTLLRSLPKDVRRRLVPVPDVVAQLMPRLDPRMRLFEALETELEHLRGIRVTRGEWDPSRLPPHLRMTFRVEDPDGAVLAEGRDLDGLRAQLRPRLRAELASATKSMQQTGLRAWTIGSVPTTVELPGAGHVARGFPALVDEGDTVALRVLDTPGEQARAMRAGTRRLLLLTVPAAARRVQDRLTTAQQLALAAAPHGSLASVVDDATAAAVDALVERAGGPAWDERGFDRLRERVAGRLPGAVEEVVAAISRIVAVANLARVRLEGLSTEALAPARDDVERQLDSLLFPGFATTFGAARLGDVERYLRAAVRRLERLPEAAATDADRMRAVQQLEADHRARLSELPPGEPVPEALGEIGWMLQELRVSHFAQGLGTRGTVSGKRVRRLLDALERQPGPAT